MKGNGTDGVASMRDEFIYIIRQIRSHKSSFRPADTKEMSSGAAFGRLRIVLIIKELSALSAAMSSNTLAMTGV